MEYGAEEPHFGQTGTRMKHAKQKLNMYEPAVFRICIQGVLDASLADYFSVRSIAAETDMDGNTVTVIRTEPMDQGGLVGVINHLNMLGIPVISIWLV
jgi:hypothetical protein